METIKQYLESLFIQFPNSAEVMKAKAHLLEMAEDKYTNLKKEGVSDNEAVAKVITEFGNLDELKDIIGLPEEVIHDGAYRVEAGEMTLEEVRTIEKDYKKAGLLCGIGVCFFICCVVPAIISDHTRMEDLFGAAGLFVFIAIGVVFMIVQGSILKEWKERLQSPYFLELGTVEYVKQQKKSSSALWIRAIAVFLYCTCFVPCIISTHKIMPAFMFVMIGVATMLMISVNVPESLYKRLLSANPAGTVGSTYSKDSGRIVYHSTGMEIFMGIYWGIMTCLYISISFITFAWNITWVVWPVAAVVHKILETTCGEEE
ncbi:MAG: hypothetical protein MJ105_02770 [Lachnospiraceae bacterium]|nr:hypothetical protein [Lachnospiraceae bacterium]